MAATLDVVILWVFALVGCWAAEIPLFSQEVLIEHVNSIKTSWKSGINSRFQGLSEEQIKRQLGSFIGGPEFPENNYIGDVPDGFDGRQAWNECPSVSLIVDQGSCGSCWAVAAAGVMTDRYCIKRKQKVLISAEDLMSCCTSCGNGCGGGSANSAWEYWKKTGIVTGGQYDSHDGCLPYSIQPCDHNINAGKYSENNASKLSPCNENEVKTPNCSTTCQPGYSTPYKYDKHQGISASSFKIPMSIQNEIMTNGPVEGTMRVYEDFLTYKSGVYKHETGRFLGNHSVRILGWGEEIVDFPYWIVANSWNTDWGDKGFFQILRGKDEAGIESHVVAGMP